jgi:DNA-binding LytR/AlgR family response regulator
MIKCIAIDDEPLALEVIKDYASKTPFLDLKATFVNTQSALKFLLENEIELVFLDIKMPDISGLDFAKMIGNRKIIFTTAFAEHAVEAFTLDVSDYLLKPISFNRFLISCQKVYEKVYSSLPAVSHIFVKDGYNLIKVNLDELDYIASEGNYLTFFESGKKTLSRMTFNDAFEILPIGKFLRTHKTHVVNLAKITVVEKNSLKLQNGIELPIGPNYKDELLKKL